MSEQIIVKMNKELKELIYSTSKDMGSSVSSYVRMAIIEKMKKDKEASR